MFLPSPFTPNLKITRLLSVVLGKMDCSVEFLDNTKGHFEPGENLHGEVTLKLRKAKKIYSNKHDNIYFCDLLHIWF